MPLATGKSRSSSRVVARRVLQLAPDQSRITVTVEAPEPDPGSGNKDWRCCFRISGLAERTKLYAYGIDGFQALQLAMVGIRSVLEPHRSNLSWAGGPLESAFPMYVPYGWGQKFTRRLEKSINHEVSDLCRQIEARVKRSEQTRRAKREVKSHFSVDTDALRRTVASLPPDATRRSPLR